MTRINDESPIADLHDETSEDRSSNLSGNRPFAEIVKSALSRRTVLQGSVAGAAAGFLAPRAALADPAEETGPLRRGRLVRFKGVSVEQATVDQTLPTISDDYTYQAFIPWGTPIEPGATRPYNGEPDRRPTPEEASKQVGLGHDGMWFFPEAPEFLDGPQRYALGSNRRGMLCVNHEYGTNPHALGKSFPESLTDVRLSQNIHGVSVLAIEKSFRGWDVVASPNSRRITVNSRVAFSGPAADSPLLQNPAGNVPLGTVNNCGSGYTPWGTYLTCEENFNGYFGANGAFDPSARQARYGLSANGFGYGWHVFDKRFDLTDPAYVNENNRFGWIVEINPFDGTELPTKRTALGRFKHEAIAIAETPDGRVAAYMGDDQSNDYCYKFLSALPWREAIAQGVSPLDEGTLYVARFNDDGTGDWLPLTIDNPLLAAEFADQAEILIFARAAADILGATPMARPEWTTIAKDGSTYWTMTDGDGVFEGGGAGYILNTVDANGSAGDSFIWTIFYLCSDSAGDPDLAFDDCDAAYADPDGRLFIGTDGGQLYGLQDQVVVFDTTAEDPQPVRLLVGVTSDEITGWTHTPDQRTAFTNIQHPGNGNPALTNFPLPYDGVTIPRDATLIIEKKGPGKVGS